MSNRIFSALLCSIEKHYPGPIGPIQWEMVEREMNAILKKVPIGTPSPYTAEKFSKIVDRAIEWLKKIRLGFRYIIITILINNK
jgi:hypothetical protein